MKVFSMVRGNKIHLCGQRSYSTFRGRKVHLYIRCCKGHLCGQMLQRSPLLSEATNGTCTIRGHTKVTYMVKCCKGHRYCKRQQRAPVLSEVKQRSHLWSYVSKVTSTARKDTCNIRDQVKVTFTVKYD